MMRVAFRTDASSRIGIGHVMRCLTLARLLSRETDTAIRFVCNRDLPDAVKGRLLAAGFGLAETGDAEGFDWQADADRFAAAVGSEGVDWLIVDHYGIDRRWEQAVRPLARNILVIDDLADRPHGCDALLDQNLIFGMESRYRQLVPDGCKLFLGPEYALLGESFAAARHLAAEKTSLGRVLVNFGGSDPTGESFKVLEALELAGRPAGWPETLTFHVVAGPANARSAELKKRCESLAGVVFYPEVKEMAKFLADMDMAIGAGGVSLWERAFMGVPSAVIAVADNQVPSAEESARRDMVWYLGESRAVTPGRIAELLGDVLENPMELRRKSRQSLLVMHTLRNVAIHPVVSFMLEAGRTERSQ